MKLKWIIGFIVILLWTGLAVFSGYHLKKDKVCPEIKIKDSSYTIPIPPQHAQIKVKKKAKPIKDSIEVDSSVHILPIYGWEELLGDTLGSLDWFPHIEDIVTTYGQIIDTTVVFNKDSLDFVGEICFDEKTKSFENFFDFNLRVSQRIKEVVREVLVPYKPEIYQNEWVILLMVITSFLFGMVL